MRKSTGVFKVGLDTELGWTTTKEHLSRIDMPVTVSENEKQTVMTLIDTRVSSIESRFARKGVQWGVAIVLVGAAAGGVFALLGMPLAREPFLYAPIPGFKLD